MDYRCNITIAKAMNEVVAHVEVRRENASGWTSNIVYSRTELFAEEAHPDPAKWAKEQMMRLAEYL